MNASERRLVFLAVFLLGMGWGARALPRQWCDQCGDLSVESPAVSSSLEVSASDSALNDSPVKHSPQKARKSPAKATPFTGKIAINQANETDLQKIRGVGPTLARRIIEFRTLHGRFRGAQDLDKVSGIGKKKMDNLLPFLIFD